MFLICNILITFVTSFLHNHCKNNQDDVVFSLRIKEDYIPPKELCLLFIRSFGDSNINLPKNVFSFVLKYNIEVNYFKSDKRKYPYNVLILQSVGTDRFAQYKFVKAFVTILFIIFYFSRYVSKFYFVGINFTYSRKSYRISSIFYVYKTFIFLLINLFNQTKIQSKS